MMIHIVNKRTHKATQHDYYVGRGSVLGNICSRHTMKPNQAVYYSDSKEKAVEFYRMWLYYQIKFKKDKKVINEIKKIIEDARNNDVYLICYCAPNFPCHAEVIKELVEKNL